ARQASRVRPGLGRAPEGVRKPAGGKIRGHTQLAPENPRIAGIGRLDPGCRRPGRPDTAATSAGSRPPADSGGRGGPDGANEPNGNEHVQGASRIRPATDGIATLESRPGTRNGKSLPGWQHARTIAILAQTVRAKHDANRCQTTRFRTYADTKETEQWRL